jgi:hypothetical protein
MRNALLAGIVLCVQISTGAACAAGPSLATLRRGHPRLLVTEADLARTRRLLKTDPSLRKIRDRLRREAEALLEEAPVKRVLTGPRLLGVSRRCLRRVYTLAGMCRLEGDRRFAARAVREMLAAAAFSDWNPSHFLDVAEMTHALGVGYDWLYETMTGPQRQVVRRAIVRHGLLAGLKAFKRRAWFYRSRFNWNHVCSGGILLGALAVAEEEPKLAAELLDLTTRSIRVALGGYAPDGGWAEGPAYWNYATRYCVYLLAALQTALADGSTLARSAGLSETGLFRIHTIGPTGLMFNFADCRERPGRCPEMFWLARQYDRPLYAWHERQETRSPTMLHLLWYNPAGADPLRSGLPTGACFRGVQVVALRSAWQDPNAVYVAVKGGDNTVSHGHLDLGSFVLDADGVRWAVDLGGDSYALPAYFGKQRWTYYRTRTEGHNTLTVDDENQNTSAEAPIVAFCSTPSRAHAVVELTAAYRPRLRSVRRGVALLNGQAVLVQDEVAAGSPVRLHWAMHTRAAIAANGAHAELRSGGKRLQATLLEPPGAAFAVQPVRLRKPQRSTAGVSKLLVQLDARAGTTRVVVLLRPLRGRPASAPATPRILPLRSWENPSGKQ